jgi:phospholipase/carboxylesterase
VVGEGDLTVVLLHGFGAPGDDLVPLAEAFGVEARFIFPEAPLSLDFGFMEGRAWWIIDLERIQKKLLTGEIEELKRDVPAGLAAARSKLDAALDAIQAKFQIAGSRVVLGGFSQGAMLALDLALESDRALAGLVLLSGTIISKDRWVARLPTRRGLPVFQSHGKLDPLLPYAFAEELGTMLDGAGLVRTFVPFMGMHEIPGSVVDGAAAFLRSRY